MRKLLELIDSPILMRRINGWLTIIWLILSIPICVWLKDSVPVLVFISVYSIVTGHWGTYQAAKVECKQDIQEENKINQE